MPVAQVIKFWYINHVCTTNSPAPSTTPNVVPPNLHGNDSKSYNITKYTIVLVTRL